METKTAHITARGFDLKVTTPARYVVALVRETPVEVEGYRGPRILEAGAEVKMRTDDLVKARRFVTRFGISRDMVFAVIIDKTTGEEV